MAADDQGVPMVPQEHRACAASPWHMDIGQDLVPSHRSVGHGLYRHAQPLRSVGDKRAVTA
jgi:hypothetical protein